jgi:hypothetical protein
MLSSSFKVSEVRRCLQIGDGSKIREESKSHQFTFDEIINTEIKYKVKGLPVSLEKDEYYKIVSWNSNHTVKGTGDEFEVIEYYGEDLVCGKEYMLIEPSY